MRDNPSSISSAGLWVIICKIKRQITRYSGSNLLGKRLMLCCCCCFSKLNIPVRLIETDWSDRSCDLLPRAATVNTSFLRARITSEPAEQVTQSSLMAAAASRVLILSLLSSVGLRTCFLPHADHVLPRAAQYDSIRGAARG